MGSPGRRLVFRVSFLGVLPLVGWGCPYFGGEFKGKPVSLVYDIRCVRACQSREYMV